MKSKVEELAFLLAQTAQANKAVVLRDSDRARQHLSTIFPRLSELIHERSALVRRPLMGLNHTKGRHYLVPNLKPWTAESRLGETDFSCIRCGRRLPLDLGEIDCPLCGCVIRIYKFRKSIRVEVVREKSTINIFEGSPSSSE